MIVIGLNYGDEGKGLTTSYLCSQTKNPLVVRFNGGQQAGHTVVHRGQRHVFSSFGAGTLQGVPTYWSSYCTFEPSAFLREYELLPSPTIYVNPLCPITTPFDIVHNRHTNTQTQHGTVGMGFGATLQREQDHYHLHIQDLFYPTILRTKLAAIAHYYGQTPDAETTDRFLADSHRVTRLIRLADNSILQRYTPIFEGAQGILLDMDFGFFPHVTRSNTTTKNALQLHPAQEVYYVTRSYLTRHGNGYLPNPQPLNLQNNANETNTHNPFQGEFRTAPLHTELLNYALQSDRHFSENLTKHLVITCLDQYPIHVPTLLNNLTTKFKRVYGSYGDSHTDIVQLV